MTPKPTATLVGWKRSEFDYDYQGRRVEKRVYTCATAGSAASAWPLSQRRRFVWYNWLMVMELDCGTGTPVNTVLRKYTWGRDLGGGLESAGGIGGLLAVEDTNATPVTTDDQSLAFLYDANGNIGQLVDWAQTTASAALQAKYEYDVYGNVTASDGSYATTNPFRFSTKYWDDETELGYWGYRYYDPRMGRWISRDPLNEMGGINLFGSLLNEPTSHVDDFGGKSIRPSRPTLPRGTTTGGGYPGDFPGPFVWPGRHMVGPTNSTTPEPGVGPPRFKFIPNYAPGYDAKRCDAIHTEYKSAEADCFGTDEGGGAKSNGHLNDFQLDLASPKSATEQACEQLRKALDGCRSLADKETEYLKNCYPRDQALKGAKQNFESSVFGRVDRINTAANRVDAIKQLMKDLGCGNCSDSPTPPRLDSGSLLSGGLQGGHGGTWVPLGPSVSSGG